MFKLLTLRLFPGCCCLCDGVGHNGLDLCEVCLDSLSLNVACCSRCAMPIEHQSPPDTILCGSCLNEKSAITRTIAPYIFAYPADYIVRSLKFNFEEKYARLMGELLANKVQEARISLPEYLMPVPLHRQRYLERGFNQAELMTKFCGSRLDLPILQNRLIRYYNTQAQSRLDRRLRKKNLRGAFQVPRGAPMPRHIALIDDVITTGSTVGEISQVLLKSGVERVDVWAFARAVK